MIFGFESKYFPLHEIYFDKQLSTRWGEQKFNSESESKPTNIVQCLWESVGVDEVAD